MTGDDPPSIQSSCGRRDQAKPRAASGFRRDAGELGNTSGPGHDFHRPNLPRHQPKEGHPDGQHLGQGFVRTPRLAERGWGFVLGAGDHRINSVHPADIAGVAVRSITDPSLHDAEFGFGGPETYTQTEIARLASRVLGKRQRIVHVPFWVIDAAVALIRPFNRNAAGFLEFFRQTAARDMVGTPVGEHSLKDFYSSLAH